MEKGKEKKTSKEQEIKQEQENETKKIREMQESEVQHVKWEKNQRSYIGDNHKDEGKAGRISQLQTIPDPCCKLSLLFYLKHVFTILI